MRWGYAKAGLEGKALYSISQKCTPFIVGRDFSGEIVQIGTGVPEIEHFDLGKQVHLFQLFIDTKGLIIYYFRFLD